MRLSSEMVDQLRKEFLVLLKNEKQAKQMDYATLRRWHEAIRFWLSKHLNPLVEAVLDRLDDGDSWLGPGLRKAWYEFRRHLGLPLFMKPGPHHSEEAIAVRTKQELPKWSPAIRRAAQKFWKQLQETLQESALQTGLPIMVEETMNLEGFQVVLKYRTQEELSYLPEMRGVLRKYQKAAQDRFPLLLRRQLPLVLDFSCTTNSDRDFLATYKKDHILVCAGSMVGENGVHVLAHEMGHHLYQRYLSQEDHTVWHMLVSGDYGTLDLREILKSYPSGASFPDSSLAETDPVLYLQLEGLQFDKINPGLTELYRVDDIRDYLDQGGKPLVKIRNKPTTPYGATSDEEAFCEAVGLLVGYGPKSLLPEIRRVMKIMFPNIRISSLLRRIALQATR